MAVIFGKDKKWTKPHLGYFFTNSVSAAGLSQAEAERQFQSACDQWATPSGLSFAKAASAAEADILVTWAVIDQAGDVLGQSTTPDGRNTPVRMTFDTAEEWTKNNLVLTAANFLSIALHELGHAIGLDHSGNTTAVMYPTVAPFIPPTKLTLDDEEGAKYLYFDYKKGISIVNETDQYASWFAFNSDDGLKWVALDSGDLAPKEVRFYDPVTNGTGKYFIRFTHRGGGTELAGGISLKSSLVSLYSMGSHGYRAEIS